MIKTGKAKQSFTMISLLAWLAVSSLNCGGGTPDQPIAFSHKTHAGEYGIDCQYCHTGVTVSAKAAVPSTNVCNNCHSMVGGSTPEQQAEIKKIKEYIDNKTSPEWVRVHNTPDFVRFSHAPHVKALLKEGEPTISACKECHGDVTNMAEIKQVRRLNMGDCVNCHRDFRNEGKYKDHGVSVSCNVCHY